MTTKETAPPQADIAPEPLDDAEPAAPVAAVERAEANEEAQQPRVMPVETQPFADARERIAQLYRDQRERDEADDAQARAELDAAREAQESADASAQHQQQRVKIVVDGKEQFLTQAELIQRAQINSAADNRLEEAKRLLKAARAERNGEDYDEFEETPQQPRHTTPTPGNTNDKLKSIVERIQIGDTDEGAQAMQEFAQVVHQNMQTQAILGAREAEMRNALDRFMHRYPQLARDPDLGTAGVAVLARTLKSEIKKVGGITDDQLNSIPNDLNGVRALAHTTAAYRAQGHRQLRDFDGVLDAVGQEMGRKFGLRPSSVRGDHRIGSDAEIQARLERKRSMPSQPRPAGVRMAPQQEYQRPKTAAEIVAEARRYRGFK
jgi:hypothetical protein